MMKENCLPQVELQSVVTNVKKFLGKLRIPNDEVDAITLSSYEDIDKWETIKEEIRVAVNSIEVESGDLEPVEQWSVEDTVRWLSDVNLEQYCNAFKENDIDGQNLVELNEADLRDLGIRSLGHRKSFMRHLAEAKKYAWAVKDSEPEVKTPQYQNLSDQGSEIKWSKELTCYSVIVRGLTEGLLEDEDLLNNIENVVFTDFSLHSYKLKDNGIVFTFENPITVGEKDELREKFVQVLNGLKGESPLDRQITFNFWNDGKQRLHKGSTLIKRNKPKTIERNFEERKVAPPASSKRINYWKEFWVKLITNGDPEDFFDDQQSRLNSRRAREVLATIRDVKLKQIRNDDPGLKYLEGFTRTEIMASLSDCLLNVVYEI